MKAVYIRTSTEEQNPELQLKDIETLFTKDYKKYEDKQSAWKDHKERKEFTQLKKDIKAKRITDLYVWDLDRLYRNRKNLIGFFKLCNLYKCKIHSSRQQWLEQINSIQEPFNEIMHDLMIQIMGWLAEEESTKKSERVKMAVRKGKVTKSYKGNKWGRKQISTFKKNRIKEMKERGHSIRTIAKDLDLSIGVVHKYITENV